MRSCETIALMLQGGSKRASCGSRLSEAVVSYCADRPDFLSSILVAKMAADKLQGAGQRAQAQRVAAEAGRLQASPPLLQWLRAQPPSAAVTGAGLASGLPDCPPELLDCIQCTNALHVIWHPCGATVLSTLPDE